MNTTKLSMLAATMLAGTIATGAHAQATNPGPDVLHAVGATSITFVLTQDMNCLSGNNPAGNNNNTTQPVPEGNYAGSGASPKPLNCATTDLQPNDSGFYVGTGSGGGRTGWRTFSRAGVFNGTSTINPFDPANTDPAWAHYQFAFSDGPISVSDQDAFVTASAANKLGNAIQIPVYVLPIAIAYNPVYGVTSTGVQLKFNVKSTNVQKDGAGNVIGGLRLNQSDYCGIFNGTITDWTDPALKLRNGGLSLLDAADPRGTSAGIPIRLVGRSDSSGTTDIFTRHLAAACGADVNAGGTNKFNKNAGGLPWNSTLNMSNVDGGTVYKGAFVAASFANNTDDAAHQSLSGAFFNKSTNTIVTTNGAEAPGKFMIANGSTGVQQAINLAPDAPSTNGVLLNGKVGYIGADFVLPAVLGAGTFSAALQVGGAGTAYAMPNAKNAAAAFGSGATAILPPQTIAASGAYSTADARTIVNPTTGLAEPIDRANPLHWVRALYNDPANTLAKPVKGYPMTGTTQMLPYQCYASANTRLSVANLIGLLTGKATKQSPTVFDALSLINTSATAPGVNVQSGIGPMPAAWNTAIAETFLKSSAQVGSVGGTKLGQINVAYDAAKKGYYTVPGTGNGLWIQSVIPTSAATVASAKSNSNCTVGAGA